MPAPASTSTNPFCAARLRPGTIDFVFEHGKTLAQLVDVLEANQWRGEITGRHGSGKSTLLAALFLAIENRGRMPKLVTLGAGQTVLPRPFFADLRDTAGLGVAVVDGYEQLSAWGRLRLRRHCKAHAIGMLLATHRSAGLPSIYRTAVDVTRAWKVVERFQEGYRQLVQISDLVGRLAQRHGNLREALFDLYDIYEARSREAGG